MSSFEYLVVLDFEATCDDGPTPDPQEVIEFPSVLVSLTKRVVVDTFEAFVRPTHHPILTPFCIELTGITQREVNLAQLFPEVLAAHQTWLATHGLLSDVDEEGRRFTFVTCGDWDLKTMLPKQCAASGPAHAALPSAYRRWVNIKRIYAAALGKRRAGGMLKMLEGLGLELEGRHHRGIDDCKNIARIALTLVERGVTFAREL